MRPERHTYNMGFAQHAATMSTCIKRKVGAAFIRENRLLSVGYNGSVPGAAHCDEVGCRIIKGHCKRTVHAELNALLAAGKNGTSLVGSDCYVTLLPCLTCFNALVTAGINRIYYLEEYSHEEKDVVKSIGAARLTCLGVGAP